MVILICMSGTDGVVTLSMISEESLFFLLNRTYVSFSKDSLNMSTVCTNYGCSSFGQSGSELIIQNHSDLGDSTDRTMNL